MLKKLTNFLTSLKFGIILFLIIAAYSIIGTVILQGMEPEFYLNQYETFGSLMIFLQFDHVYSSTIYLVIIFIFIINLVGCTIKILPGQLNRMKSSYAPKSGKNNENLYEEKMDIENIKKILQENRFKIIDTENGAYAVKHVIGHIGSTITHLGIIVIILGAVIGNMFAHEGRINIMPGEIKEFKEFGFAVGVNDFYIDFREDGSIEQYYSELTVYEGGQKIRDKKIWVNNPLNIKGIYFYQSNYGWASNIQIRDNDGQVVLKDTIKDNSHVFYEPENLVVFLYGFFPDFSMDISGNPITLSQQVKNPAYAVVLYNEEGYVDSHILPPGDSIKYNDLTIEFTDSVMYTGLQYRQDFGYYYVLIGSIILTLGILLSFYFYPKYILIGTESVIPVARQNAWGFTVKIKRILKDQKKDRGESQ